LNTEQQDDTISTYAPMLKKADGLIDWDQPPSDIDRQIRALNPWPGTYMHGIKGRVKILKAHMQDNQLILDIVQPEGKKPMDFVSAVNGGYISCP